MSIHIGAKPGDIANTVLITGDPLRAKHYAETMLTDPFCYSKIRGMFGYTGKYKNKRISIQGTGIGIPSTAIYVHELIHSYGASCIMRVGTCGAIQEDIKLGQLILAKGAATDSKVVIHAKDKEFEPLADPQLIQRAQEVAYELGIFFRLGNIFSTDLFYSDNIHRWAKFTRQGVLAVDMETSILYALAEQNKIQSLTILTVSDNILTGEMASSEDRELKTADMMKLALEIAT